MDAPEVRYAKSGDVNIAYSVAGDRPFDLVFIVGSVFTALEYAWDGPPADFFARLASFSRLILFDKRGTGLSDRVADFASPEARMDDIFVKPEPIAAEIERFLSGIRERGEWDVVEADRVLATVLFTDVVASTAKAVELGDRRWRELLERHHALIRRQLVRYQGRELDTAGDGFFASFDGPARAIRCACAISAGVRELGLELRAGLHTGECELVDGKVGGIAVHVGARVAKEAAPGEVLVSGTVKDLVAGSGLRFAERGRAELKGVPGTWELWAVEPASALPR